MERRDFLKATGSAATALCPDVSAEMDGLTTIFIDAEQDIATVFQAIVRSVVVGSQRGEVRCELF